MTEQTVHLARQLSDWLDGSDIALLELTGPGTSIRLRRNGLVGGGGVASAEADGLEQPFVEAESLPSSHTVICAGSVGVLLHAHPLREDALVRAGQRVAAGQTVALLKIGAVLLAVPAPRDGVVSRVIAADRSLVGFGDPLVELH